MTALARVRSAAVLVALVMLSAAPFAQSGAPATNPRFAAWKLKPATPPAEGNKSSNIMTYAPWNGTGMSVKIETTTAAGEPGTPWGYNSMLDGKEQPLVGQNGRDSASVTVINDKINLIIYKNKGQFVQMLVNVLSADNNRLDISYISTTATGETRTTTAVYERIVK